MGKTMKRLSSIAMPIVLVAALSPGDRADARYPADGPAGKSASRGDAMIEPYLAREAAALEKREFDGATSPEAWRAARRRLRDELLAMRGLWPISEKTPLQARVTGTVRRGGNVLVEKLHFQSRPGLYVTANLYRPEAPRGRLPAILYVCGHASR